MTGYFTKQEAFELSSLAQAAIKGHLLYKDKECSPMQYIMTPNTLQVLKEADRKIKRFYKLTKETKGQKTCVA